ncbi:lactonase family protein [Roseateles chitinivorans]|uniref:lactonase family protein n=1 Tax=Roseateles chitinivorans TaxID=2917965 RepID=UPI003D677232
MFCYVGSRTTRERNARGEGISVYRWDEATASLELVQVRRDLVNPSYLALARGGTRLYAVHGDLDYASSFAVDALTGRIEFLNQQSTHGKNPVHLALDPREEVLIVSNYKTSSLAVMPVTADGTLMPIRHLLTLDGPPGPHRAEQLAPHPHHSGFDPSGRFVVVPDKGGDRVYVLRLEEGSLHFAQTPFVSSREASGPRHHVFDPGGHRAYVVNELNCTVTSYAFDPSTGELSAEQVASTLPDTFAGDARASAIAIGPRGDVLYVSNRGHDSLSVFRIESDTGRLSLIQSVSAEGVKPRFFTIAPNGRTAFVLNEDSDSIVPFAVNPERGTLSRTGSAITCGSPVCMVFRATMEGAVR